MVPGAKHVVCRFHHQQSVTHWLQPHCTTEEEIPTRQRVMQHVLQTHDQRTVRRRLACLREQAPALGITTWITQVEAKLPQLFCSVGSVRLPATTKAIERFFRTFQRFDATRRGFHSVRSATRELLRCLVVSVCTQQATTGQAPIEVIMPEARSMPLYRLINDPFRALQEWADVKREAEMADLLRPQEGAASMLCEDTMQRSHKVKRVKDVKILDVTMTPWHALASCLCHTWDVHERAGTGREEVLPRSCLSTPWGWR